MSSYNPFQAERDPFEKEDSVEYEDTDISFDSKFVRNIFDKSWYVAAFIAGSFLFISIINYLTTPRYATPETIQIIVEQPKEIESVSIVTSTTTTLPVVTTTTSTILDEETETYVSNKTESLNESEVKNFGNQEEIIKKTVQVVVENCIRDSEYGDYATALGTGVVISAEGYIVTNAHVLEDCSGDIYIATINNVDEKTEIKYFAELLKKDENLDIALLKISRSLNGEVLKNSFDYFDMVSSQELMLGDSVEIWGYPTSRGSGSYSLNINLTKGTISGFEQDAGYKRGWLVTDADITYGNSGGAALDIYGRLIGMPTFGVTEGASWIGYLRTTDVILDWIGDLDSEQDEFAGFPQLEIKEIDINNIPKYNREEWNSWIDEDGDCQNTRHEVLQLESYVNVIFTNTSKCYVQSGRWFDPYNGEFVYFASDLDIDHFVPLYNVHNSGGWQWSEAKKTKFANNIDDPDILIAVLSTTNRDKSASSPDQWKPENEKYWCEYAYDWIRIKYEWGLTATQSEWSALINMIAACPSGITYNNSKNSSHTMQQEKILIYQKNG